MTAHAPAEAAKEKPEASDGPITHRQIMAIITGLMLGMFLAALDQTVVSTAIRRIGDDLHGLSVQAWVTTAFLITATITTPLYGKLSDIYGRKPFYLLAITIFITGSALCGLATNMYMLAAFRAFQGLGAGGLFSLALAIMADILSPQQRPKYMGYFMAVFATSSVLGPLVGGFLSGQNSILGVTGWRWIFYVNVPIGLAALAVVQRRLTLPPRRNQAKIDWWGTLAIVVTVVPLLLVAERGRDWGWGSPASLVCYLLSAAGLVGFVLAERRMGDAALIPPRMFRERMFSLGSGISFISGIGMFAAFAVLPLYLQIVKGASPTKSGLLMLPLVLGLIIGSMTAGRITAATGRYKIFPVIGNTCMIAALALLSTISAGTADLWTNLFMLLFGVGIGLGMQSVQLAMQNAVAPRDIGVATSSGTFFRQMGGTLGTAVFLSILFSAAPTKISHAYADAAATPAFRAAAAAHPDQIALVRGGGSLNDTSFLRKISDAIAHPFLSGFASAMDIVFLVAAAVSVLGLICAVAIKEIPLRTLSGIEASRAEASAAEAEAEAAAVAVAVAVAGAGTGTGTGAGTATGGRPEVPRSEVTEVTGAI